MGNMALDAYTFARNPTETDTLIRQEKSNSHTLTYTSVGYFDWGARIAGKSIELSFDYMSAAQYDALETLYLAAGPHVWNPDDGESKTFNVHITNLTGRYFLTFNDTMYGTGAHRRDVRMTLLIMSQV